MSVLSFIDLSESNMAISVSNPKSLQYVKITNKDRKLKGRERLKKVYPKNLKNFII